MFKNFNMKISLLGNQARQYERDKFSFSISRRLFPFHFLFFQPFFFLCCNHSLDVSPQTLETSPHFAASFLLCRSSLAPVLVHVEHCCWWIASNPKPPTSTPLTIPPPPLNPLLSPIQVSIFNSISAFSNFFLYFLALIMILFWNVLWVTGQQLQQRPHRLRQQRESS